MMKIADLLDPKGVTAELKARTKQDALAELTDTLLQVNDGLVHDDVVRVLLERERLGSTGIGDGVAIPHGKLKNLEQLQISFGRSREGVDFDSMDGRPAHLFFLLVAPEESVGIHLKTLARISKLLKNGSVRQRLLDAVDEDEIYRIIIQEDEAL